MLTMPRKTKWRKVQRGTMKGLSKGARTVDFGEFGLQALEPCWLTAQQIEAVRVTLNRKLKKIGELFIRVFPDKPISKKPAETRMGKGKGSPEVWAAVVKRGRIMFEISGVEETLAREILSSAKYKLPIKVRVVGREEGREEAKIAS